MLFREELEKLYKEIPEIDKPCPGGCSKCCHGLDFFFSIHEALMAYSISGKYPERLSNGHCCYLENGKCSIYDYRPLTCRSWGIFDSSDNKTLDNMYKGDCKYGIRTSKPMTSKQYLEFMTRYVGLCINSGYILFPINVDKEAGLFQMFSGSDKVKIIILEKPKTKQQAEIIKMKLIRLVN